MSDDVATADILPLSASIAVAQMHEAAAYQRYLEARANIDSVLAASPYSKLFAAVETFFIALGRDPSAPFQMHLTCPSRIRLDSPIEDELRLVDPRAVEHAVSVRIRQALGGVLRDLGARLQISSPRAVILELDGLDLHLRIVSAGETRTLTMTCGAPYLALDTKSSLTRLRTSLASAGVEPTDSGRDR